MLRERVRERRGERDLLLAPQSRKREEKEQRAHDVVKELAGRWGGCWWLIVVVAASRRHYSKVGGVRSSSGSSCSLSARKRWNHFGYRTRTSLDEWMSVFFGFCSWLRWYS